MTLFLVVLAILEAAAILSLLILLRKKSARVAALAAGLNQARLELEEGLRHATEEKNRIFAILESMAEGVIVVDADQKVLLVNSCLEKLLGWRKGDLAGRYFWEVFRDPGINAMIERCFLEKRAQKKEHSILLSDFTFEIQVSPVFRSEDFLGIAAVFYDVTRLKELERMRSEFVANVSHELKTPLTSIIGFVETLKEGAVEDPENRLRFLDIIDEHSKKLSHLIEDLLFLSKMESGAAGIKKERLDAGRMLQTIIKLFGDRVAAKKIQVRFDMEPAPFLIPVDVKTMDQAFSNLIDNAIKYNRENGEITVRARYEDGRAVLRIKDTGVGIPPSDLDRVFERFYRVDKSRSRESGGTGLGLAIVKHIVECHGGEVRVESEPQKGSVFIIALPLE
jgi:two-component system phosphate regulon sensor histidine kinase PhoR